MPLDPAVGLAAEYNSASEYAAPFSDGFKQPDHHGNHAVMILSVISTDGEAVERTYPIDPIDAYVGERLKLARIQRGLSLAYLGSCVGVTFQQVQKYESGANRISASRLAYFSRQLGVPVSYFYQGMPSSYLQAGEPIAPDQLFSIPINLLANPETQKLITTYYAVDDPKQREAIISILRGIANRGPLVDQTDYLKE